MSECNGKMSDRSYWVECCLKSTRAWDCDREKGRRWAFVCVLCRSYTQWTCPRNCFTRSILKLFAFQPCIYLPVVRSSMITLLNKTWHFFFFHGHIYQTVHKLLAFVTQFCYQEMSSQISLTSYFYLNAWFSQSVGSFGGDTCTWFSDWLFIRFLHSISIHGWRKLNNCEYFVQEFNIALVLLINLACDWMIWGIALYQIVGDQGVFFFSFRFVIQLSAVMGFIISVKLHTLYDQFSFLISGKKKDMNMWKTIQNIIFIHVLILERIIWVQSFCIQSLYPWTKLTWRNERHLIIKLCTCIINLINFL